jgi:hypothetical protein
VLMYTVLAAGAASSARQEATKPSLVVSMMQIESGLDAEVGKFGSENSYRP